MAIPDNLRYLEARIGRDHLLARLAGERLRASLGAGVRRARVRVGRMALQSVLRVAGMWAWGRRNFLDLQIRERRVPVPGLPTALDGLRVAHLSDLHLDLEPELVPVICSRLAAARFDLVVFTGDYEGRADASVETVLAGMERVVGALAGRPAYGVLGNHDWLAMVPPLEALGIRMLVNEAVAWSRGGARLWLVGLDDSHHYRLENVPRAMENVPEGEVTIVLAHTPDAYREVADAGATVMLAGHTHAGQICLPSGTPVFTNIRAPRHLARGAWRYGALQGYTSAGIGGSGVPVRYFCPPEIAVHILTQG